MEQKPDSHRVTCVWWFEYTLLLPPEAHILGYFSCGVVGLFDRIRMMRRCGLIEESESLGVGSEVSDAHARSSLSWLWIRM